jgi:formylglycine-generating enzyme required for sulfatase activity
VTGGTSNRLDYPSASVWPATVSDFRLDKFEITVARFRRFVGAWVGGWRPTAGAGKHTHLHGGSGLATTVGGFEGGWDPTWNANLATTSSAWNTSLSCDTSYQTWTSATGGNDERPINCASWYEI